MHTVVKFRCITSKQTTGDITCHSSAIVSRTTLLCQPKLNQLAAKSTENFRLSCVCTQKLIHDRDYQVDVVSTPGKAYLE